MKDKGVKSAANAELYAFYQSLIPQGSKEKDGAHEAFNLRSKSMVTNFMDIPEEKPSIEDEEVLVPVNRASDVSYSNIAVGTFQTPDRGQGSLSPTNRFMKDVIMENTEEDDMTPDSAEMKPANKYNKNAQESFKTHDFASIDSFV